VLGESSNPLNHQILAKSISISLTVIHVEEWVVNLCRTVTGETKMIAKL
jgi:hypothetical protein